jgi:hypothetical protein
MKKKLIILFIVVTSIVIILIGLFRIPVKKAIKMDIVNGGKFEITTKETKILSEARQFTGPAWCIVGKNNIRFDGNENPNEQIILTGDYPRRVSDDVFSLPYEYIFVFEGYFQNKILGFNVFNVKKWSILSPIERTSTFLPNDALTPYDYLFSHEVNNEP